MKSTILGYCDVDPLYIHTEEYMQFDTKCNVCSLKLYYSWRGHRLAFVKCFFLSLMIANCVNVAKCECC